MKMCMEKKVTKTRLLAQNWDISYVGKLYVDNTFLLKEKKVKAVEMFWNKLIH